jgi:hypothetical protein
MRTLIESLGSLFEDLDGRQRLLLKKVPDGKLFWTPIRTADTLIILSAGGAVIRSAAMVEQAFLGITRRLWDDPFEWTLPEKLSDKAAISAYLDEVVETRQSGLAFLSSDADLSRQLPAPEKLRPVVFVLAEALAKAENYLGRGEAVAKMLLSE